MKKIILVLAAIVISASAYAQTDTINKRMSSHDMNQNQNLHNNPIGDRTHPDGVIMQNGKLMKVKNGQMSVLEDKDMTLSNGTKFTSDGSYLNKDGKKMKLTEGQHMDLSGNMTTMQSNRDRNTDFNQNMQNNPGERTHPDGVMMQNGKLMKVKNGQMSVCHEDEMTLSNGTKIMSDGSYLNKDGRKMKLTEGQHMDMSGKMTTMQTNRDRNTDFNQNMQNNPGDRTHPDGVMMQNGKLMKVKNGQMSDCHEDEMTLSNGTKIKSDGSYLDKDGRKMKLSEGQHMDMSGNMTTMQTSRDRNTDFNQNMQNNHGDRTHADGVMMQNGKLMKVKNGQMSVCHEDEMTLSNGTKIKSDGSYLDKDGRKMKLSEGQHMDMSGNMTTMQTNRDRNRNTEFNQNRQNNTNDRSNNDGVVMQDGKIMKVKNGQMSILQDNDMTINGTKIMSDGSYVDKDGKKMKLKEGQRMDMTGKVTSMNTDNDRNMYLVPDSLKNKQF